MTSPHLEQTDTITLPRAELDALKERLRALADRAEITELVDRYVTLLDAQDAHGYDDSWPRMVFTDDCRLEFPVGTVRGLDTAAAFHFDRKSRFARTHHLASTYGITLDGDTARLRVHIFASHVHHDDGPDPGGRFDIGGYSEGEAVRTPDGWRISRWRFHLVWSDGAGPRPGPAPAALRSSQPRPRAQRPTADPAPRKDDTVSGTPAATLDLGALRTAPGEARLRAIETFVCRTLETYLDVPPAHRIHRSRPLYAQGIDSLTALAFQRKLENALRIPVPTHHLLREQSVSELAATLDDLLTHADRAERRREAATASV
ncbi:nuclear transport factor 2 family protein [Streptomyces gossypiisoli]|uniref:nuclear transport factor 2 family protein n=1 Tax=Streptomyces gossypiisoli TaxID=2748864 RepID=UPI0015DB2A7D|nr:nuclear transport factor 2 family protein [Streptomyces gossypiisoli]